MIFKQTVLWAELCPSANPYGKVLTPSTSECNYTWKWAFKEMTKLKSGCQGGRQSKLTDVPIKREDLDTQRPGVRTQRKEQGRTRCSGGHLQGEKRRFIRNQTHHSLDLGLLASRLQKINFCCLSHLVCDILSWHSQQNNTDCMSISFL